MAKRSYYRSPFGVWMTDQDVRAYTPPDEKRSYVRLGLAIALLGIVSLVLALVQSRGAGLGRGIWAALALACAAYLLVVIPMARKSGQLPEDIQRSLTVYPPLHPGRTDYFWYERSVADETYEDEFKNHIPEIREASEPKSPG